MDENMREPQDGEDHSGTPPVIGLKISKGHVCCCFRKVKGFSYNLSNNTGSFRNQKAISYPLSETSCLA